MRRLNEVTRLVETLVASWEGVPPVLQARRWHRVPYGRPVGLTPLEDVGDLPAGPSLLVLGSDISAGGVSFWHPEPLPCRRAAVTFFLPDGSVESIVTRLKWTRFTRQGTYRSGGQFVETIALPPECERTLRGLKD